MGEFVKNSWYIAGWADEIDAGPVARRLLDMPVVIFRGESGAPIALLDRCPHRFAPLSRGMVCGDGIRCGYHGLAFGADGNCIDSPFGLEVPPGMHVDSFPVVERHKCLWFWPGDKNKADPALIPDFSYHVDPAFRTVFGVSHIKAHFELVTDNLMDLTHTRYLHPGFGGDFWVPEVSFFQDGETVTSRYKLPATPPSDFSEAFFAADGKPVFERDAMRWDPPASMLLTIDMGFAEAPDIVVAQNPSSHLLVPETETTCHYFWASACAIDALMTDEDHYAAMVAAFDGEDAPMLEAVQQSMEGKDFWEMKPAILAYDNAGIRVRRMMRQKMRAEQDDKTEVLTAA